MQGITVLIRKQIISQVALNAFILWSGGAMVLGKLSAPGRPTNLDNSRARAYCTCRRCGWSFLDTFVPRLSFKGVVALLFFVHGKHLRSCRDGQLT